MSIFSSILNGELTGYFVWKDKQCFSIMTIAPTRQGHLLIIPNEEVDHWDDVPEETLSHLFVVAKHIAKAQKEVIPCRRIGVSIVGLEVPHAHIHLIPLDTLSDLDFANAKEMSSQILSETASSIREVLISQGYSQAQIT